MKDKIMNARKPDKLLQLGKSPAPTLWNSNLDGLFVENGGGGGRGVNMLTMLKIWVKNFDLFRTTLKKKYIEF